MNDRRPGRRRTQESQQPPAEPDQPSVRFQSVLHRSDKFEFADSGMALLEIPVQGGFALAEYEQFFKAIEELYEGLSAYQYYIRYQDQLRSSVPTPPMGLMLGTPTPQDLLGFLVPDYPIVLRSMDVHSLGLMELLGAGDLLRAVSEIFNSISLHQERTARVKIDTKKAADEAKKDEEYRNASERRRLEIANDQLAAQLDAQRLANLTSAIDAAGRQAPILKRLGLSADEIQALYISFVGEPIAALSRQANLGVFGVTEVHGITPA